MKHIIKLLIVNFNLHKIKFNKLNNKHVLLFIVKLFLETNIFLVCVINYTDTFNLLKIFKIKGDIENNY